VRQDEASTWTTDRHPEETEMTREMMTTASTPGFETEAESEAELMRAALSGLLTRRELIRRGRRAGLGLAAVAALALTARGADASKRTGTSIPPNCIYVCCDGTCDSWKMCLTCVKWPKTAGTISR